MCIVIKKAFSQKRGLPLRNIYWILAGKEHVESGREGAKGSVIACNKRNG